MQIYPAIDLYNGKCVRLYQGQFNQQTVYDEPIKVAARYSTQGANWLHVIDLDAAKDSNKNQLTLVKQLITINALNIQYGGGIRTAKQIENLLNLKLTRVILGSMAVKNPKLVADWFKVFGAEKIVLALDIKNKADKSYVATEGWQKLSNTTLFDLLDYYVDAGLKHLLCTDISRDGTLSGPNIELYSKILQKFPSLQLQASGGISSLKDIKELKKINVSGVIIGRALYEKKFNLTEALAC
jgi:phosphoribosylformimino-5-aminoimidazole carboxamide ribotide isomerase